MRHRRQQPAPVKAVADPVPAGDGSNLSVFRRWWVPRAVAMGLWALIAASVVLAALAWARPVASVPPAVVVGKDARCDVAGFAELFEAQYVEAGDGDEASLAPLLGNIAPSPCAESGDWFASSSTATAVTNTEPDRWRVESAQPDRLEASGFVNMRPLTHLSTRSAMRSWSPLISCAGMEAVGRRSRTSAH